MAGQVLARFVYKLAADSAGFTKGVKQAGIALKGFATKSDKHFKAVDKSSQKSTKSQISDLKKLEKQRDKNEKEMNRRARRQKMRGTHSSQRPVVGVPMHRNPDPLRQPVSAAVRARGEWWKRGLDSEATVHGGTGPRRSIRDRLSGSGGGGGDSQPPGFLKGLGGQAAAGAAASFGKAAITARLMAGAFGLATAAGTALKAVLIGSLNVSARFEEQFQVVKAITSGTAAEFKGLEKDLIQVSINSEHTADSLLLAAEVLGRAGFEAKDVGKALDTVADLATAGGLSVAKAADLSVRMLKSFGMTMDELPHIANMLAHASASANVSIQSLGEGFKFTGAIAKTAGLSFSDVTTALALLGETGLEAGLAGRALQAMLMDLIKPTDAANNVLHEMGIVTHDVEGKMLSISSVLQQLKDAQAGNEDVFGIFNRNSARAVTALSGVIDEYKDLQDSTENATTAIDKQSDTIRDSLNKNLAEVKNNLAVIGKDIGDFFIEPLKEATDGLADFLKLFSDAGRTEIVKKSLDNFMAVGPGFREEIPEEDPEKRKARKARHDKLEIQRAKEARAAEKVRQLSTARILSGDPIEGGEKGFVGAIDKFIFSFQQTLVEGKEALEGANLAGKVKTIFSNIFTDLAKEAGISAKEAADAAIAGQKEFMKSSAFLDAKAQQDTLLAKILAKETAEKLQKENLKATIEGIKAEIKARKQADIDRVQAIVDETQKSLDDQLKQFELDEKAFKEVDNILQGLPEKYVNKLEEFILSHGFSFGGVTGPELSAAELLDQGRDFEKQAGVDELIDDGKGIMEVWDAAKELKSGWTTAFFMAKKLALDFYDTVESSFLAVSGEIGGIFVDMVKGMAAGGPLMAIGSAMMSVLQKSEAFQGFMETTGEILGVLANALNPFVEVIAQVMVPVLKFVAKVLLASFTPMALIWNAIASFLNVFGANLKKIDIGAMWSDLNSGLDDLGNSVDETADKFDDLNESMHGIAGLPKAIKLNLLAFQQAINSTRAARTGRSSASPGSMSSPIRMHTGGIVPGSGNTDSVHALLTPGEQVIPAGQSAGDGTNIQIGTMVVKVTDVKDFMKKLNNEQEWRSMARSGSLYGKGVVGSR